MVFLCNVKDSIERLCFSDENLSCMQVPGNVIYLSTLTVKPFFELDVMRLAVSSMVTVW